MRLFRRVRGNTTHPVEIDTDSGDSSRIASNYGSSSSSCSSDCSTSEGFVREGLPTTSSGLRANTAAPPKSGNAMRCPLSARSGGSHNGDGTGRQSGATSVMSPLRITNGSHLRSLSNGGTVVPVAYSDGSLVAIGTASSNSRPQQQQQQSLSASRRSMNASMAFANYMSDALVEKKPTMNILVVGAPQVGKSMFVNAYRAAVTSSLKWPTAPVGICGFYGTTSVEPFPNHPMDPTWMCIDTPGRLYTSKHEVLLEKLVEGMPWKTKLAGAHAMSLPEVKELAPIATNAAHQCVVVVPATDLIEDQGWGNVLRLRSRYITAADADQVVLYVKGLVSLLRALLNDAAPFVVITKMDKVGGCSCHAAREAILALMEQCVPANRVFFAAFPGSATASSLKLNITMDPVTRENLVHLHEEICFTVQWKRRLKNL